MGVDDVDCFFVVQFLEIFRKLFIGEVGEDFSESHAQGEFSSDFFYPFRMIAF